MYKVMFREDSDNEGNKGKFVLSSKKFLTKLEAISHARTVSKTRDPMVLEIVWDTTQP